MAQPPLSPFPVHIWSEETNLSSNFPQTLNMNLSANFLTKEERTFIVFSFPPHTFPLSSVFPTVKIHSDLLVSIIS